MSTTSPNGTPEQPATPAQSGHISLRPEGTGPRDTLFQFQKQEKRLSGAVGISIAVHVGAFLLIVLAARFLPRQVYEAILPDQLSNRIVYLPAPGPGGGGGGGDRRPEPPKPAEIPKAKPPVPIPETPPEPRPEPPREEPVAQVPLETLASTAPLPGVLTENTSNSDSRGSGVGSGAGPGRGSGIGEGFGGGTGGGAFNIGNGVLSPIVLFEKKPQYTAEAMRAKVQGTVWLECIVMPDGTVGNVEIVRSLDSSFGLDQEAVKAAKQWRFRPGTRLGEPVPVRVTIELTFTLR
jgi:protein TonB